VLFDAGPEEDAWERNVKRLRPDLASVEVVQLSHWHRDHSGWFHKLGGMLSMNAETSTYVVLIHTDSMQAAFAGLSA
jgi:7,8-dihydropterin-6-yl-methyl-4-(beta-D-ribofuranosyl)aminobenzene 5'-phosphate synthase